MEEFKLMKIWVTVVSPSSGDDLIVAKSHELHLLAFRLPYFERFRFSEEKKTASFTTDEKGGYF